MTSRYLEFVVKMRDQLTPEISKITSSINRLGNQGKAAISNIGHGAAALYGIGQTIMSGLQPAIEMNNQLGKIKGLGESAEGLELLKRRALEFSTAWGESAADFVDASYDIKSAIDGLTAEELTSFTEISSLTGKATQTSGKIMTDYLGTMYSVLGAAKEADKIKWAENLMAQTAYTANKFKSDGTKIAQAFSTLGNQATLAGVKVNEQFAILGTLQNEMGGGESATKYGAFLSSIGQAGDKLGMNFRDANNNLKTTPEILEIIKKKYGDVIDDKESAELKKALGRKEGLDFIKALLSKTDDLKKSIGEIGSINGLDDVKEGAEANVDVFQRLNQIFKGLRITIGSELIAAINPFLNKLANAGSALVSWLQVNKNISRLIGLIIVGTLAIGAFGATATLLSGVFGLVKVGILLFGALAAPVAILALKIGAVIALIYTFRKQIAAFVSGFISGFQSVGVAFEPLKQALGKVFAIIEQIIGRLTGSGEAWQGWTEIGKIAGEWFAISLNTVVSGLELVLATVTMLGNIWLDVFDGVMSTWDEMCKAFENGDLLGIFGALFSGIGKIAANVWDSIRAGFIEMINVAIGWLNKIGMDIPTIEIPVRLRQEDINVTRTAGGIAGIALNQASQVQVNGTNAKSIAPVKGARNLSGAVTQNRTANITNNITINGQDGGTQASRYVAAQEQANLGA